MKTKAEQIYEAVGEGYGFNGSKEQCIEVIETILKSDTPAMESLSCRFCDAKFTDEYDLEVHVNRNHNIITDSAR